MNYRTLKGAQSELVAAADLMSKGHEVYRSLQPCSPFDLVAVINGQLKRIEVRTGVKATHCDRSHRADILAIVFRGIVTYEPPLDHPNNPSEWRRPNGIVAERYRHLS